MEKEGEEIKPLQAIKNIELSLMQLKSKIGILQKEQIRTAQNIENLFSSAVPIIKKKLHDSIQTSKLNEKRNSFMTKEKNRLSLAKKNRFEQEQQINHSKIQMNQSKAFESMHIKEMSRKNNQIIVESRKQMLEKKKEKRNQVRQIEDKGRNKVQDFHILKKHGFKRQKDEERKLMLEKLGKTKKKVQELQKQQQYIAERTQKNKAIFTQLKDVSNFLYRIKPNKFLQISKKLHLQPGQELQDEEIQLILYQLEEELKCSKKQEASPAQKSNNIR